MVDKMKYILRILIIIMINVCVIGIAGRCSGFTNVFPP